MDWDGLNWLEVLEAFPIKLRTPKRNWEEAEKNICRKMQKKWICLEPKPFVSIHHLLIFKHNFKHLRDFSAMLLRISKFKLTNFAGRTSVMHNIVICKSLKNHFSVSQHWSEGERRVFEIKVSNWFLRKKKILWGLISI